MPEDLACERDYYRSLVELSTHDAPEPLLRRALAILVNLTGAREAYIEIHAGEEASPLRWSAAEGCDATRLDAIRATISRGIVAEAMATGATVVTAAAVDDERFKDFASVREHAIEAVLCAPIGRGEPVGAIYLQGRRGATELVAISDEVRERVEIFADALAPIAELLVRREDEHASPPPYEGAFAGIVARSSMTRELVERIRLVATLDVHVLFTGPSGAGKTAFAHALHAASRRHTMPFVEINCAAIPESLLESELFGAEPGAHSTVPRNGTRGKVEAAEGGTLFLDEIGELAPASQAKLLQLLQDRTYYRLGASTPRKADVRIVAATNVSLPTAIAEKRFREDLYYRLKVFEARVPSLAERPEDVIPLARRFCSAAAARHELSIAGLSPAAIRAIQCLDWPGNVRELAHRIESALLHAHLRGSARIEARDVLPGSEGRAADQGAVTLQDATREFQRKHVLAVLESTDWNISEAARQLDIARSYLYTLIGTYGFRRSG